MSQALMDYVSARHGLLTAVLDLLAAEFRLSDEGSSALAVTEAETAVDTAAARLAEAAGHLDRDRRPVGWTEMPALAGIPAVTRREVVRAALRDLCAQYAEAGDSSGASGSGYAEELLALAARNLAADADAHAAAKANEIGRLL